MLSVRYRVLASACLALLVMLTRRAEALELRAGVGLGGILLGTVPRFAVSPHVGLSWRRESGLLFALNDNVSIVPATGQLGVGVYNQTGMSVGYVSKDFDISLGPSLSIYSMPACGPTLCGRVVGLAPGGHGQGNFYVSGRLGISVSANLDWVGGRSLVLPGGWAAMIVAGPVFRWEVR